MLKRMETQGYEIKRGKFISFRAPGQERFTRAKTLGDAYTEEALKSRIENWAMQKPIGDTNRVVPNPKPSVLEKLINIEAKKEQGKGAGYVRWAKIHNLKLSADTMNALEEYGGYEAFEQKYAQVLHQKLESGSALNASDKRLKQLNDLKGALQTCHRTKAVYQQFCNAKNPAAFYSENEAAITAHKAAKAALSAYASSLPSIKELEAEITRLQASRTESYAEYKLLSVELKQMETIRKNIHTILDRDKAPKQINAPHSTL